jgi:hypothetical protein
MEEVIEINNMDFKIEDNQNPINDNNNNDDIGNDKELNGNILKKKKTKLINIEADNNDEIENNGESNGNITFGDENQLIVVENTLEDKENIPFYKKASSRIQLLLPSNIIEEQIVKREILENKDNNISANEDKNENRDINGKDNDISNSNTNEDIKVKIIYENKSDNRSIKFFSLFHKS